MEIEESTDVLKHFQRDINCLVEDVRVFHLNFVKDSKNRTETLEKKD